jgi:predicted nucleotidyltransferase
MQIYELNLILQQLHYSNKVSWEETRFLAYITAQVNSAKTIKPTDIIRFSWDKDITDKKSSITNNDIERLKNKANSMSKLLQ